MDENKLQKLIKWVGTTQSLILHSVFFVVMLCLPFFGVESSMSLLILTTVVSLEAIFLNIFIQMGVNRHADEQKETRMVLSTVQETIEDVQDAVEDVQEDVQEIMDDEEEEKNKNAGVNKLEKLAGLNPVANKVTNVGSSPITGTKKKGKI